MTKENDWDFLQFNHDYIIIDPEGNERWILQSNTAIFDDKSDITAIEGLCRDITETKLANAKLKESERRFHDLVWCSADWIWEVDKNGKFIYFSEKIKNILGYKPEELIEKTPFELMPDEEAKRIENIFKKSRRRKSRL